MHPRPVLAVLLTAACAAAPEPGPPQTALLDDLAVSAAFPAAAAVVDGFDAPAAASDWDSSDTVLFGLRLRRGEEEHRWLLQLDVVIGDTLRNVVLRPRDGDGETAPQHVDALQALFEEHHWFYTTRDDAGVEHKHQVRSAMMPVGAVVLDADDGRVLGKSVVRLPKDLLHGGLLRAATASSAHANRAAEAGSPDRDPDAEESLRRLEIEAWLATIALLQIVRDDNVLASYFWQVVEKPSLWSVLTHLGVSVTLDVRFADAVPASALPPHQPRAGDEMVVPVTLAVNGAPALFADLLVGGSARPFALCGGLRAAVARYPSRDDVRFDLVLLAARKGK